MFNSKYSTRTMGNDVFFVGTIATYLLWFRFTTIWCNKIGTGQNQRWSELAQVEIGAEKILLNFVVGIRHYKKFICKVSSFVFNDNLLTFGT